MLFSVSLQHSLSKFSFELPPLDTLSPATQKISTVNEKFKMIILAKKALKTLDNLASLQNTFKTLTHFTLSKLPALSKLVIDRRSHIGFSGPHRSHLVPQFYFH